MKKAMAMIFYCVISSIYITSSYGEESKPISGDYRGDKESFVAFKDKYAKEDWPTPDTIAYYDPDNKGASVIRYAHWTPPSGKRTGVIVHFNGRTEFIEKNIYTYKDLLERGFEIWAFDWRGQGFSERLIKGKKEKQKHNINTFDTYLTDASYFIDHVAHIKEATGKKVLLAHSMGGQIALRYLLEHPDTFKYAVLSSPLLKLPVKVGGVPIERIASIVNIGKRFTGFGSSCTVTKDGSWSSDFISDSCMLIASAKLKDCTPVKPNDCDLINANETNKYSNDVNKMSEINCLIESSKDAKGEDEPDLRLACPTSDWFNAANRSIKIVKDTATKLKTPLLIVRALPDNAVDNDGQTDFCKLTKNCTIISVGIVNGVQTGHELLVEQEPIRRVFFELFDGFVGLNHRVRP